MKNWKPIIIMTLLTGLHSTGAPDVDAFHWNRLIGRGINLGNVFESNPKWVAYDRLKAAHIDLIADAGFNSVRIPVRWSAYTDASPPYAIDPDFLSRIDRTIEKVLSRGMVAIVNIHHFHEFTEAPAEHRERFLAIWKQLSEHYRDHPPELYFEILNEPHGKNIAPLWNGMQLEAVALVRKTNPERALLLAPLGWNRINQLKHLELPEEDRNIIVSVHYYEPFNFTHQGASWVNRDVPVGTEWKGTGEEKAGIRAELDEALSWSKNHRVPINIGEFGAYEKADLESRIRWTSFVRTEAEARGFAWNYWEFFSSFGVYDLEKKEWREGLRTALLAD